MEQAGNVSLLVILATAAIYDVKYQKIPNILTFSVMLGGIAYHSWFSGIHGCLFSLGGASLGIALLIVFYLMGKMGAGDVKLMGAVGSILGPTGAFNAFLLTAIVGGIYAIIILLFRGRFVDLMNRMWLAMRLTYLTRSPMAPALAEDRNSPALCYGIAIAIGTSLSMMF